MFAEEGNQLKSEIIFLIFLRFQYTFHISPVYTLWFCHLNVTRKTFKCFVLCNVLMKQVDFCSL